jgi:hypothetical protein
MVIVSKKFVSFSRIFFCYLKIEEINFWLRYVIQPQGETNEQACLIPLEAQTFEAGFPVPVSSVRCSPNQS